MPRRFIGVVLVAVVILASCGGGDDDADGAADTSSDDAVAADTPRWPAPPDPLERIKAAGLTPERHEFLQVHRHAHLDVFFDGRKITVPAGIGINVTDPGVKHVETPDGPQYGDIEMCDRPCISPLHTHAEDGVLHTESKTAEYNTLGQFFTEWGIRLDATCADDYCKPQTAIAVYVDGDRHAGDPAEIELRDGREIAVVIGKPPKKIPSTADLSKA